MILFFMCAWAQDYLRAEVVESTIKEHQEVLTGCSALPNQLYRVRFSVDSKGTLTVMEGEECFQVLSQISFPEHPSASRRFLWHVAAQDGVLFPQSLIREKQSYVLFPGLITSDKKKLMTQLVEK